MNLREKRGNEAVAIHSKIDPPTTLNTFVSYGFKVDECGISADKMMFTKISFKRRGNAKFHQVIFFFSECSINFIILKIIF